MILQEMAKGYDGPAYNYRKDPNALADMRYAGSEDQPAEIDMNTGEMTYDLDLDDPAVGGIGDLSTDAEKRSAQDSYMMASFHDDPSNPTIDREQFMADFEDEEVGRRLSPDDSNAYMSKRTSRITESRISRAMIRKMIYAALR